jgi:hypothetical protein
VKKVFLTSGDALRRLTQMSASSPNGIRVNVTAVDGGGLSAQVPAQITLSIIGPNQKPPVFRQPRYSFEVPEDVAIGTQVGSVSATASNIGEFHALVGPGYYLLLLYMLFFLANFCSNHFL